MRGRPRNARRHLSRWEHRVLASLWLQNPDRFVRFPPLGALSQTSYSALGIEYRPETWSVISHELISSMRGAARARIYPAPTNLSRPCITFSETPTLCLSPKPRNAGRQQVPLQPQRPQGNIGPGIAAWVCSDVLHDFAELADDEGGDESVGNDTGGGAEGGGARRDAPAAGSDGNDSDSDDEEMNARVLREIELVRQAREQQQQQEQVPQNDPPPDNGTSPMASSGAPPPPPAANLRAVPLELTLTPYIALQMPAGIGGLSIR